jgi:hypothetical protein
MKEYYTYAYLREDKTPYYIGKGKGDRVYKKRKSEIKPPKNKSRIIFLKQNLTEEEAFKHEIYMIAVFGRKDLGTGILHNRTNGGDGSRGWIPSEEWKNKMSSIVKGRKHTEQTKQKLSECLRGKKRTKDQKENTSQIVKNLWKNNVYENRKNGHKSGEENPWYGKKHTDETILKQKNVKCKYQYEVISPCGEIFITNNLKDFCRQNDLQNRWMYAIVSGKAKTHKGWTCKRL